jgi:DNA-binding NarL/FixJ family response regulator
MVPPKILKGGATQLVAAHADSRSNEIQSSALRMTLTASEQRTLELFASGLPRREIARVLNRAPKTISNSLTTARDKLGARSLAEAAARVASEAVWLARRVNS